MEGGDRRRREGMKEGERGRKRERGDKRERKGEGMEEEEKDRG